MSRTTLFDYWRSSASYRLRIALNLAGIEHDIVQVDLLKNEHKAAEHMARHPQGLVPVLNIDGQQLTQSLAIIDYLNTTRRLNLLPDDPLQRLRATALAHTVGVDIHPVCNSSVVAYVMTLVDDGAAAQLDWMRRFIRPGLEAFEAQLAGFDQSPFCTGNMPGLADICLIPQLYNARRWGVNFQDMPKILAVQAACDEHAAFATAYPTDPTT